MWVVLVSNKGGGEEVMVAAGTLSVSCVVCLAIASNDARTPLTEWGGETKATSKPPTNAAALSSSRAVVLALFSANGDYFQLPPCVGNRSVRGLRVWVSLRKSVRPAPAANGACASLTSVRDSVLGKAARSCRRGCTTCATTTQKHVAGCQSGVTRTDLL